MRREESEERREKEKIRVEVEGAWGSGVELVSESVSLGITH